MTRKDFALIANTILSLPPLERVTIAHAFVVTLSKANPSFKADKFLFACQLPSPQKI